MAKKKPEETAKPLAEKKKSPAEEVAPVVELTPKERRFLVRTSRFLLNIRDPQTYARARTYGYSEAEHQEGWRLYKIAMGEQRPLELVSPERSTHDVSNDVLQALDAFENAWFPRTRMIIRRFARGEAGKKLEAAFFKNLEQQPLGPGVLGSVRVFLSRLAELEKSPLDGAKKVSEVLTQRGLTKATLDHVRSLLERAEAVEAAPNTTKKASSDGHKLLAEQREALAELKAWREEWRVTLTPVFGRNALLALGLIAVKSKDGSSDPPEDEDRGSEDAEPLKK